MKRSILIRVVSQNFNQWRRVFDECKPARLEYGIKREAVYRDETNPDRVLVHLDVENQETATAWFKDKRFKAGVERAGKVSKEVWMTTRK